MEPLGTASSTFESQKSRSQRGDCRLREEKCSSHFIVTLDTLRCISVMQARFKPWSTGTDVTNVIARDSLHLGQLRFQEQARLTMLTISSQAVCRWSRARSSLQVGAVAQIKEEMGRWDSQRRIAEALLILQTRLTSGQHELFEDGA